MAKKACGDKLLSDVEQQKLLDELVNFILEGYTFNDIKEYYQRTNGYNPAYLYNKFFEARKEIEKRADVDIETTIHTHLAMYDEVWKFFENTGNQQGKNRALYLKEKLLNLYPEESLIEINNTTNYNFEREDEYNISNLSEEDKKRLEGYFNKMNNNDRSKKLGK